MKINSLAVFCGSKIGNKLIYNQHASELGEILAKNKINLIYGGGHKGIMGSIADAALNHGGTVTGVIPKLLLEWEQQHTGLTQLLIVDDMHTRKKKIYEMCDAALLLPGGYGSLDEFFEMITWNHLSIHNKHIFIMNSDGFYEHLIQHIFNLERNGFLYEPVEKRLNILNTPQEILPYLNF